MIGLCRMTLHPVSVPLRHAWRIAHGTRTVQHNLIVELSDADGRAGLGEAASIPYFGVTPEGLLASAETFRHAVQAAAWSEPAELWSALDAARRPDEPADRFVQCAIDAAAHDLWGRVRGKPTRELLTEGHADLTGEPPLSDYTLGMGTLDEIIAKAAEFPDFPIYKVKLGSGDLDADLALVAGLRQALKARGSDALLRVDANTGWKADETIAAAPRLGVLGVEFIEQPMPVDSPAGELRRVRQFSTLPLIADEACMVEADIATCADSYDGVNIKLNKCGGMTPALRMIRDARDRGLSVMMGCMTETSVGISAIAQLLPFLDFVDMDGALLLADDPAAGVRVVDGVTVYPAGPGHGVELRG